MAKAQYRYLRGRRGRAPRVEVLPPDRNWAKVTTAAEMTGRSKTTIYLQFFKGEVDGLRANQGHLYVDVDQIK